MDRNISSERSFSFRDEFPDQWYTLNNPEQTSEPMSVTWQTRRIDFPPNMERLKIGQVVLYFSITEDMSWNGIEVELKFSEAEQSDPVGGIASPVDGVVSTRRASAGEWASILGKSIEGEWQLSVPELKQMFLDEKVKDILFVITYEGQSF